VVEVVAVEVLVVVGGTFVLRPGLRRVEPDVRCPEQRRGELDQRVADRDAVERGAREREAVDPVELVTDEPGVAVRVGAAWRRSGPCGGSTHCVSLAHPLFQPLT
jgi:hypothetical protein